MIELREQYFGCITFFKYEEQRKFEILDCLSCKSLVFNIDVIRYRQRRFTEFRYDWVPYMKRKSVVIIDGASTAVQYAPLFRAYGVAAIHIQTREQMSVFFRNTFRQSDYEMCLLFNGDYRAVQDALSEYQILAVLPGMDSGVYIADKLSSLLGCEYGNGMEHSRARRDKYELISLLGAQGFKVPNQTKVRSVLEATHWVKQENTIPVVVKPLQSAGVDGVSICQTLDEVEKASQRILGEQNIFGDFNEEIVIQEFIQGQEYMIDTVSYAGIHHVLNIWKVRRAEGPFPYPLIAHTISDVDPIYGQLSHYVRKLLSAVSFSYGPANTEVKINSGDIYPIEMNGRLHGRLDTSLVARTIGSDQVSQVALSMLAPAHFLRRGSFDFPTIGYAARIGLISSKEFVASADPKWEYLTRQTSYISVLSSMKKGSTVRKTTNLTTTMGIGFFFSENMDSLLSDYESMRRLEEGFIDSICM